MMDVLPYLLLSRHLMRLYQSEQGTGEDLVSSAPVQSGSLSPSAEITPHISYLAQHLPPGNNDPGKIPCGFAKGKKIFVHSQRLKKVQVGVLTTLLSRNVLLRQ